MRSEISAPQGHFLQGTPVVKKVIKKIMIIIFSLLAFIFVYTSIYVQQPKFGKLPSGERLEKIKQSPNYKKGKFQNINETPIMTDDFSYYKAFKEIVFADTKPDKKIPSKKTDLLDLNPSDNVLVWFGHSSYFIQVDGKKILVDPVLSGRASPVWFTTKAFEGTDPYTVEDIPEIDYLIITHDHWDHLDYETVTKLKSKIKKIICPLGVGEHFEHWDFNLDNIIENDWNQEFTIGDDFTVHTFPARHFSGRGFSRNKSLWASFVLETSSFNLFIGGDSGYDDYFEDIGNMFDRIDLAILDNGQYDKTWKYAHLLPKELFKAAKDLKATRVLPVHNSKFPLAYHAWNEPLKKITELNKDGALRLITPMIGEQVNLDDNSQEFIEWWNNI